MSGGRLRILIVILSGLALVLASLLTTGYMLTRPARLRALVMKAVAQLGMGACEVGDVRLRLKGLEIRDLRIGGAADDGSSAAAALKAESVLVGGGLITLLMGGLSNSTVYLRNADINLQAEGGAEPTAPAWNVLARLPRQLPDRLLASAPNLVFETCAVHIRTLEDGRPQLLERWVLSGFGTRNAEGYHLDLRRQRGDDPLLLNATLLSATHGLILNIGWVHIETLTDFLPPEPREMLETLAVRGRIRAQDLELRLNPAAATSSSELELLNARIEVEDVEAAWPFEDGWQSAGQASRGLHPRERFAQFSDGRGTLIWNPLAAQNSNRVQLGVQGKLRRSNLQLEMKLDSGRVLSAWRHWTHGGGRFRLEPEDVEQFDLAVLGLDIPTAAARQRLMDSDAVPRVVRELLRDYTPSGEVDVSLSLPARDDPRRLASGEAGRSALVGTVNVRGGRCRYFRFPYDFADVRGEFQFASGRTEIVALTGRHGPAQVELRGSVEIPKPWTAFDLVARARGVPLDADLFAALPDSYRTHWRRTPPVGLTDLDVRISRPPGDAASGPAPLAVSVDSQMLSGSLGLGDERLHFVNGALQARNGVISVDDLYGETGVGSVRVSGVLQGAPSPGSYLPGDAALVSGRTALRVSAYGNRVRFSYPEDGTSPRIVTFEGLADSSAVVAMDGAAQPAPQTAQLSLQNGQLRLRESQLTWQARAGKFSRTADGIEIEGLHADSPLGEIDADGRVAAGGGALDLNIQARGQSLEALLGELLAVEQRGWVSELGVGGPGAVRLHLQRPSSAESEAPLDIELDAQVQRLTPRRWPLPLSELRTCMRVRGPFYEILDCDGKLDRKARWSVQGRGAWDGASATGEWSLQVRDVTVDRALLSTLPPSLRDPLIRHGLAGQFDLSLERLSADTSGSWSFAGRATGNDIRLQAAFDLLARSLSVLSEGRVDPDGTLSLIATVRIPDGSVSGRPVTGIAARLITVPGHSRLLLEDLRGQWCAGQVLGGGSIDIDTGQYELSLEVSDMRLADLLGNEPGKPTRTGTLSGRIEVFGELTDPTSLRGTGEVVFRNVSPERTPLLEPLAHEASRRTPLMNQPFTIDAQFELENHTARLRHVELAAPDLRMVGAGTANIEQRTVDLQLFGAHPRDWPRVELLTDMLEAANRQLVKYRMYGPIDNPKIEARPLPSLAELVRVLFGEK